MPPREDVPAAIYVRCPECGEESLHSVLKGNVGTRGGYVLQATVSCSECGHVHHAEVREARDRDVPVVVSEGGQSRRGVISLAADEEVEVEDLLIVDDQNVLVTGIETKESKRVERAKVADVMTLWAKAFDNVVVKFAINLGQKTISKQVPAKPEDQFHVGDEHTFGRLRVTVHSIKVKGRLLRRGSAEASDVVRIFAKPTRPDSKPHRPEKAARERSRADRAAAAPPETRTRGARFGARKAREKRDRAARSKAYETEEDEEEET